MLLVSLARYVRYHCSGKGGHERRERLLTETFRESGLENTKPNRTRPRSVNTKRVAARSRSIRPRTSMCWAVECVTLAACQSVSEARQKSKMRSGTASSVAIESGVGVFAMVNRSTARRSGFPVGVGRSNPAARPRLSCRIWCRRLWGIGPGPPYHQASGRPQWSRCGGKDRCSNRSAVVGPHALACGRA
jgi:hypothetical protein